MNRQGCLKGHSPFLLRVHGFFNVLSGPLTLVLEQIGGEVSRTLDTNASVAQRAGEPIEEVVRRRVMKIDVVRIGEDEFHQSKGIVGTWPLPEVISRQIGFLIPLDL